MATAQEMDPFNIPLKMADFYVGVSKVFPVLSSLKEVTIEATPHDVVLQIGRAKLLRYKSSSPARHKVPVLVVYALINRPYILDMQGKSMLKSILDEGFDVYLLDWACLTPRRANLQFTSFSRSILTSAWIL